MPGLGIGIQIGLGGGGGGAPSARSARVESGKTGAIYTVARLLGSTSALSLISGTNGNLTIASATGVISAAAAIADGASQTAVVREVSGQLAVEYPITLKGQAAVVTPTPTPIGNAALLAALPTNPKGAVIGASLEAQGTVGTTSELRQTMAQTDNWSRALDDRFQLLNWREPGYGYAGYNLAVSGATTTDMHVKQSPVALASDADFIIYNPSRNSVQLGITVASFTDPMKADILAWIAAGKAVFFKELYEAGISSGGAWVSGSATRATFADSRTEMNNWCAAQGVPVIPLKDIMTYVDGATSDILPKDGTNVGDGRHNSSLGGYLGGKSECDTLAKYLKPVAVYDHTAPPNLFANAGLTGTSGTLSNGITGMAPDGVAISRGTADDVHTTVASVVTVNGVKAIQLTADVSGAIPATTEYDTVQITYTGLTVGSWYEVLETANLVASGARRAVMLSASDGNNRSLDGVPMDTGLSSQVGSSSSLTPMPSDAMTLIRRTEPLKATGTTMTVTMYVRYAQDAGGACVTRISKPMLRQCVDPTTGLGPVALAVADAAVTEGTTNGFTLSVMDYRVQTITWSKISGPAAFGAPDGAGAVTFTAPAFDKATPANNTLTATYKATDQNNRTSTVTVTRTVASSAAFRLRATGAPASSNSDNLVLTEPAGAATGDLLVACIGYRDTPNFTLPSGWTLIQQQTGGNTSQGSTGAIASALMAYCVRGASASDLTFVRTGGNAARGVVMAYYNPAGFTLDTSASGTLGSASTVDIGPGVTTAASNELLIALAASGRIGGYAGLSAATAPANASGTTTATGDPMIGTWTERADTPNSTNAQVNIGVFDAIKKDAGATGDLSVTHSASSKQAMIVAAFKSNK